jgi:hypothetical protein
MSQKDKKIIAWFYKSSSGELHVGLPILKLIKENNPEIEINFIFADKKSFANVGSIYKKIIFEIGNVVIGAKEFYIFLMKNLNNTTLIMTCFSGHCGFSRIASNVIKKNKVLFYPHAYALHGTYKLEEFSKGRKTDRKKRYLLDGKGSPYIILNSSNDADSYYKRGCFDKEHMILAGSPGYTKSWLKYYKDKSSLSSEYLKIKKQIKTGKYKHVYFVPIRPEHKIYLTKENYDYLIDSVFWLAEKNSDSLFLLKPHPRQKNINDLSKRCNSAVNNNIILVNESTLLLSDISDLTISFWSSAIQDSLAVGTPAVEFFRHHVEHPQLLKNEKDTLISLYVASGFCPFFSKKEDVQNFLNNDQQWKKVFNTSIRNFKSFFTIDVETQTQFLSKINNLFKKADAVTNSKNNASFLRCVFQLVKISLSTLLDFFYLRETVIRALKNLKSSK